MKRLLICTLLASLVACGGTGTDDSQATATSVATAEPVAISTVTATPIPTVTATPTVTPTSISVATSTPEPSPTATATTSILTSWVINDDNELSAYINDGTVLVNVQSVEQTSVSDVDYAAVTASGIPNYEVLMTVGLVDWLNNRPKAATDFEGGTTRAVAGNTYEFGADIGYINDQCEVAAGQGYWPPGPACPSDISRTGYFPMEATPASSDCDMGANTIGFAVNGVSIYGWYDGQSYNNAGVWNNLASISEAYDVDICGGHAAGTNYHHHHYSDCWARVAGEDYSGHSEIYGYAADGYPVYGPYQDTDVLAQSCWKKRDYDVAPTAEGYGCVGFNGAVAGERNCVLVDPYDPSLGVEAASSAGPDTDATVSSLSSNTFTSSTGFYLQDYYYDSSCTQESSAHLDQYNGHSDDTRGYHYHLTIATQSLADDVPVTPTFPFTFGPRFAGQVQDNAVASCDSGTGGAMGPPPGR